MDGHRADAGCGGDCVVAGSGLPQPADVITDRPRAFPGRPPPVRDLPGPLPGAATVRGRDDLALAVIALPAIRVQRPARAARPCSCSFLPPWELRRWIQADTSPREAYKKF